MPCAQALAWPGFALGPAHQIGGAEPQQSSQTVIALSADVADAGLLGAVVGERRQADPGGTVARGVEAARIADRHHQRVGDQRTDAGDLLQAHACAHRSWRMRRCRASSSSMLASNARHCSTSGLSALSSNAGMAGSPASMRATKALKPRRPVPATPARCRQASQDRHCRDHAEAADHPQRHYPAHHSMARRLIPLYTTRRRCDLCQTGRGTAKSRPKAAAGGGPQGPALRALSPPTHTQKRTAITVHRSAARVRSCGV